MRSSREHYRSKAAARIAARAAGLPDPGPDADPVLVAKTLAAKASPKAKRKAGRPPAEPGTTQRIGAVPADWREMLRIARHAREHPRSDAAMTDLDDLISYLLRKLGPAADPAFVPDNRRVRTFYRVTDWDGLETEYDAIPEAAKVLGVAPSTLASALARQAGVYERLKWRADPLTGHNVPAHAKCEKVREAVEEDGAENG